MFDRYLIIDDHPLYCDALRLALEGINPKAQVNAVTTATDAHVYLDKGGLPEMVILDLMLPDTDGLNGFLALKKRLPDETKMVVISGREEPSIVRALQSAGADAFIGKSLAMDEMIRKLRRVMWGEVIFPNFDHADAETQRQSKLIDGLSPAQVRILAALADGRLNKQIAYDLELAEATVKSHLTAIYKKLGVSNRTQAILVARQIMPKE
ncbi:response regulator transcription factor [Hirschia litorea]|uniref:LuxR C-terminal-related transcriptional regulator n=1 Tax=Hirschia litorea TaxID=1199156 RepID=A0ABW2IPE5_9PROT